LLLCSLTFYLESIYFKFGGNRITSNRRYMLARITNETFSVAVPLNLPMVQITWYPFCELPRRHSDPVHENPVKYKDGCDIERLSYLHTLIQLHSKECWRISYNLNWNKKWKKRLGQLARVVSWATPVDSNDKSGIDARTGLQANCVHQCNWLRK